jgi:hypothetical protein
MTDIAALDKPISHTNFAHRAEVRLGAVPQTADAANETGFARIG